MRVLLGAGTLLILGVINGITVQKEQILRTGTQVFLELRPVDPRSLMQGDYMRLDYNLLSELNDRRVPRFPILNMLFHKKEGEADFQWPEEGNVIIRQPAQAGAEFIRIEDGSPLESGELRLHYRSRGGVLRVGTDAFYFQEGSADLYSTARFGELRVAADGSSVLIGLRDMALQPLGTRLE